MMRMGFFNQERDSFLSLKSKIWSEQMFTIHWYLETGMFPFYYCGSGNQEERRDFRCIVKHHYEVDKNIKALIKIMKSKKLDDGTWEHEYEIQTVF